MKSDATIDRYLSMGKSIQLSSPLTSFSFWVVFLMAFFPMCRSFKPLIEGQADFTDIVNAIFHAALFGLAFSMSQVLVIAEIEGRMIWIKTIFTKPKKVDIEDIDILRSSDLFKFCFIQYKRNGEYRKGLIINSKRTLLTGRENSASRIIRKAKILFKNEEVAQPEKSKIELYHERKEQLKNK